MNKPANRNKTEKIYDELSQIDEKGKKNRTGRFVVSALSSIPWVGGVIAASSALHGEKEQGKIMLYKNCGLKNIIERLKN